MDLEYPFVRIASRSEGETLYIRCGAPLRVSPPLLSTPPFSYWLHYILSIMYCSENNHIGSYLEETKSCSCPTSTLPAKASFPAPWGYMLSQGVCRNEVPDSTDHYIGFETDLQDMEMRFLLQKRDNRISIHGFLSATTCG
ncbi:hypothetical protein WMY93_024637 [Mugilogobius chulae]|uniref:BRINP C-terminal domain-containing protein n=1 Tax=Mugilogobius chulae TaxID=88201 RepID=A0AAW0NB70_9GOBI